MTKFRLKRAKKSKGTSKRERLSFHFHFLFLVRKIDIVFLWENKADIQMAFQGCQLFSRSDAIEHLLDRRFDKLKNSEKAANSSYTPVWF